jgi:hypothetical protein
MLFFHEGEKRADALFPFFLKGLAKTRGYSLTYPAVGPCHPGAATATL